MAARGLPAALHTYAVDGVSSGLTTDFKPTVVVQAAPIVPQAFDATTITATVNDRESPISSVTLNYALNGAAQAPVDDDAGGRRVSGDRFRRSRTAPASTTPSWARAGAQSSSYSSGYFSGVTPISTLRTLNALGEPLYNGYAARIHGTVTASGFSAGTNDDYVAGRHRRDQCLPVHRYGDARSRRPRPDR